MSAGDVGKLGNRYPNAGQGNLGNRAQAGQGNLANRAQTGQGNRNINTDRNFNSNTNVNRDWNADHNWNVDVDVDHGWGGYGWGAAAAGFAAGALTSAAIGSVVYSLPASCTAVVVNGITYQQCGSTWYQPQFVGSSVEYIVVNQP